MNKAYTLISFCILVNLLSMSFGGMLGPYHHNDFQLNPGTALESETDQQKPDFIHEPKSEDSDEKPGGILSSTRADGFTEENAHGGSWLDSFGNLDGISYQHDNIQIKDGSAYFSPLTSYFNLTTTADFDAGTKDNISTNTDKNTIPNGEIQMTPMIVHFESFDGNDEQNFKNDSDWYVTPPSEGSIKYDQDGNYSGNASLRIKTKTYSGSSIYLGALLYQNHSGFEVFMKYEINTGSHHYSYIRDFDNWPQKDTTLINYFGAAGKKIRYYNGKNIYEQFSVKENSWYKYKLEFNFATQKYSGWIDGDTYTNFLIANNCACYETNQELYAGALFLLSGTAWDGVNVTTWFDNLTVFGYPEEATWESNMISLPTNMPLSEMNLEHYNLTKISKINKIQWLIDDVVKAEYNVDIKSGLQTIIRNEDLSSGSFLDIDNNFKIKVFLSSNQARSPAVTQISLKFESLDEGIILSKPITKDPAYHWDRLIINKEVPVLGDLNITLLNNSLDPITGYQNIEDSGEIDISTLNSDTISIIQLKARFHGSSYITPRLDYWGISWKKNNSWRDTFYQSERVSSFDGVELTDGECKCAIPEKIKGYLNSSIMQIPENFYYDTLIINKTERFGTSLEISIYDAQTNSPISGFQNLYDFKIDISEIDPQSHPRIRLKAVLDAYIGDTSALHDWSLNWTANKIPYRINLIPSDTVVYRTFSTTIIIDGYDLETEESLLSIDTAYRPAGLSEWYCLCLSNLRYENSHWLIDFSPVKDDIVGMYDFEINCTDEFDGCYNKIFQDVIEVKNNLPSKPELILSPNKPRTADDLEVTAYSTDIEGESITYSYLWYRNDELQEHLKSQFVGSENTSKDEKWRAVVTPFDGNPGGYGSSNSTSVSILNTPPIVKQPLPKVTMNEDEIDYSSIDLNNIFFDIDDDELIYSVYGNNKIEIDIESLSGKVTLTPEANWFGNELLTFTANDTESDVSTLIEVEVKPQNDPPRLIKVNQTEVLTPDQILIFILFEDKWSNLTLFWEDIDGDIVKISTNRTHSTDIDGNIDKMELRDDVLIFKPENRHVGEIPINVSLNDLNGSVVYYNMVLKVMNTNDPPFVKILKPDNFTVFRFDELIDFQCAYSDPDLTVDPEEVIYIKWTTNLSSNLLGEGNFLQNLTDIELIPGTHRITVTVKDKAGLEWRDSITVIVEEKEKIEGGNAKEASSLFSQWWILFIIILIILIIIVIAVILSRRKKRVEEVEGEVFVPEEKPAISGTLVTKPGAITAPEISMEPLGGPVESAGLPTGPGTALPAAEAAQPAGTISATSPTQPITPTLVSPPKEAPPAQLPPKEVEVEKTKPKTPAEILGIPTEPMETERTKTPPPASTESQAVSSPTETEEEKVDLEGANTSDFVLKEGPKTVEKTAVEHDEIKDQVEQAPDLETLTKDLQTASTVKATEESAVVHEGDTSIWRPDVRGKIADNKEVLAQIEKLAEMRSKGILTEAEFEKKKQELLK